MELTVNFPKVLCHTEKILSIGLSYTTNGRLMWTTNDYITMDLTTSKRLYLKDLIIDIGKFIDILQDSKTGKLF